RRRVEALAERAHRGTHSGGGHIEPLVRSVLADSADSNRDETGSEQHRSEDDREEHSRQPRAQRHSSSWCEGIGLSRSSDAVITYDVAPPTAEVLGVRFF